MQLLHLPGEPPQLAGQVGQQRIAETWVAIEQLAEAVTGQRPRFAGLEGHGHRRARLIIEQGQLTEGISATQRGDDGLIALGTGQHDLDGARAHEVEAIAGVTLVEDDLAAPEPTPVQVPGDVGQRALAGMGEERRVAQLFDDQVHASSGGSGVGP